MNMEQSLDGPLGNRDEPVETSVTRILDAAGIAYSLRMHSTSVYTVEDAARERGVRPDQIVKVMVVRRSDHTLIAVLVPGDCRLSLKKLSAALGEKRLTLATPQEIEAATGYTIGAISPVGLPASMPLYVDIGIARNPEVAISAGRHDAGLSLKADDLLRLVGGLAGDYVV